MVPIAAKKILIVEDHQLFRAMLVELIESEPGITVCGQTDNVAEALTLIDQTRPDAALVDLTLNGPSGLELISDLSARNVRLPMLVLSMHPASLYAQRVIHAGARGFISKQEPPEAVIAAIRTLLEEPSA